MLRLRCLLLGLGVLAVAGSAQADPTGLPTPSMASPLTATHPVGNMGSVSAPAVSSAPPPPIAAPRKMPVVAPKPAPVTGPALKPAPATGEAGKGSDLPPEFVQMSHVTRSAPKDRAHFWHRIARPHENRP